MTDAPTTSPTDTGAEEARFALERSEPIDRHLLAEEVANRRARLATSMREHGLDALVLATEANAFYLTGYETTFFGNLSKPFVVVLTPDARVRVVCHVGEATSVRLDAIDVEVHPYVGPAVLEFSGDIQIDYQLPAIDATAELLAELDASEVGIEESWHFIPGLTPLAVARLRLRVAAPLRDASQVIWQARRVKSSWEIGQMNRAAEVCEAAHRAFAASARIGMTERELNRLLRGYAYQFGAEKIGYSGIVAGIDRAPLGGPTDRAWERGQLLFVDLCLQLGGGYFADFNRIYASQTPTAVQTAAYSRVVDALDRGRKILAAGVQISDLAAAMIGDEETIYARVGHGLGLEMPEPPSLSPQDATTLRAGEVICIEPNTFVTDVGWLVSEETVAVTDGGFQLLSPAFPRELEVIG
jgi:Xaa-Pro aminopeptidase